jgi:hypothetical protein
MFTSVFSVRLLPHHTLLMCVAHLIARLFAVTKREDIGKKYSICILIVVVIDYLRYV